jgi:hypothetical protein
MRVVLVAAALLLLAAPARAADRLDRAARGANPLYVHPELGYLLSDADRAQILSDLRAAQLPFDVRIIVMPALQADESGGDAERMLWAIDDRLPKARRLLISVDEYGNFELVPARLDRQIDLPFEVQYDREKGAIVPRLRAAFQAVAKAKDGSAYYQRERPTDPLDPLPENEPDRADDQDGTNWGLLVGSGVGGVFAGVMGWGLSVAIRWGRRA